MNAKRPKGIRVEGRTKLHVSHLDRELTFIHQAKDPGMYFNVREQILANNLKTPTIAETASLIYAAWQNPEEKYSEEIIERLRSNGFLTFTGILYVQNEGAYIQDNPKVKKERLIMKKSKLVKKLEANDPTVRFVPFGYKIRDLYPSELAKNKFIQALAGEEGAEKLAIVASKYKLIPSLSYIFDLEYVYGEPLIRTAELFVGVFNGLVISGGGLSYCRHGYAFGIEASSQ